MTGGENQLYIANKAFLPGVLLALLSLQSCALATSYQKFSLEPDPRLTFQERMTFSSENGGTLFFFPDGTFLLVNPMSSDVMEDYLERRNYKIYGRFSDYRFNWGKYQVEQDTVQMELLEKVHQWGFMGITRWKAKLKNQDKEIEILPGPLNRNPTTVFAPTFNYEGESYIWDDALQDIKIEPEKAWVNK